MKNSANIAGIVVSNIATTALDIKTDYIYRINDSTEFRERWPRIFVDALQSISDPPLMGVVGPMVSDEERTTTLIHDFVHRTHMEIFSPNYYPVALLSGAHTSKWMSRIYGHNRTFLATGVGIVQGIEVSLERQNSFVPDEKVTDVVIAGRRRILDWLSSKTSYDMTAVEADFESTYSKIVKSLRSFPVDMNAVEDDEILGNLLHDKSTNKKNIKSQSERQKWCIKTKQLYNVKPYVDWGTNISDDQKVIWKEYACNMYFIAKKLSKRGVSQCGGDDYNRSLSGDFPLIAVMAATTTRKISDPSVSNIALFTILLPSLVRSLDCGFRYMYVMGYDAGDKFYDSKKVFRFCSS